MSSAPSTATRDGILVQPGHRTLCRGGFFEREGLAEDNQRAIDEAGGQALIVHGIVNRATEDIDIFAEDPAGVQRVAGAHELPP